MQGLPVALRNKLTTIAACRLFTRIDANADGSVDWREFSTYMLLENDGAARWASLSAA